MALRIGILAFPEVEELALVGVYEVLAEAATSSRCGTVQLPEPPVVRVVGTAGKITCANGLVISPHVAGFNPEQWDVLVIPGGPGWRQLEQDGAFLGQLTRFGANHLVASACTGALILARAGLLRDRKATTHAQALPELSAFCEAVPARVVEDGNVITAGGVACSIDLGLTLLRRLFGSQAAVAIARTCHVPEEMAAAARGIVEAPSSAEAKEKCCEGRHTMTCCGYVK